MCSSLTAIEIPSSVLSMKASVFEGCSNLTIYCESSSKPTEWVDEWNIDGCTVIWGYALDVSSLNQKIAQTNKKISLVEQLLNIKILANKPIPMQSVTYSRLVQLRDQAKLVSGMFYRITDYQCTTAQIDTRAMNNRFDIIVQALSADTLSEAACADYHREYSWNGPATIRSEFIADSASSRLIEGSIIPYYYEYIDFQGGGPALGVYKTDDIFIGYGYVQNDQEQEIPAIYKTDRSGLDPTSANYNDEYAEPDFGDAFVYVGRAEIAGETYDKWQKIDDEDTFTWESDAKCYLYTNVITNASNLSVIEGIQPEEANIPAWELKYCLDNDTTRFAWACSTDSISQTSHYSFDEPLVRQPQYDGQEPDGSEYQFAWGNQAMVNDVELTQAPEKLVYSLTEEVKIGDELYYGSELIEVLEVTDSGKGVIYYMKDEWNNECPYDFKNIQFKRPISLDENGLIVYDPDNGEDTWVYTFTAYDADNAEYLDASVVSSHIIIPTHYEPLRCVNNIIDYDYVNGVATQLNDIVFLNTFSMNEYKAFICYSNSFGPDCSDITFGNSCYMNTFRKSCSNNLFGHDCIYMDFYGFNFGNIFGVNCTENSLEQGCSGNSFGPGCKYNTFGCDCKNNTFGNDCYYITFENNCSYNAFGDACRSITFRSSSSHNIFGHDKTSLISYVRKIQFNLGCCYIRLVCADTSVPAYDNLIQNITLSAGVSGTYKEPLELQVTRNAAPVVYEASGTTHIILD
jgi:hypothetical protein